MIDSSLLSTHDENHNPLDMTYVLRRPTVYGKLVLLSKTLGFNDKFTQLDLLSGNLIYHNLRSRAESSLDVFVFRVTNKISSKEGRFYLRVLPKLNQPPYLEEIVPLVVKLHGSTVISKRNLNGLDGDTRPEFLMYIISKHPQYGALLRKGNPINSDTFTQQEINDGHISYLRKKDAQFMPDHFLFKFSDGKNVGHLKIGKIKETSTIR